MGNAWPCCSHGHYYVAHKREESPNRAEIKSSSDSELGSARSEPGEDYRPSEPQSRVAARAAGRDKPAEQIVRCAPRRYPDCLVRSSHKSAAGSTRAGGPDSGGTEEARVSVALFLQRSFELPERLVAAGVGSHEQSVQLAKSTRAAAHI